jgi:hypothetical protein
VGKSHVAGLLRDALLTREYSARFEMPSQV